jgi:hypothetical protein
VNYLYAVDDTLLNAGAGLAFQYHNDWCGQPTGSGASPKAPDKLIGGLRAVPPPACRARAHDVRRINYKHGHSLLLLESRSCASQLRSMWLTGPTRRRARADGWRRFVGSSHRGPGRQGLMHLAPAGRYGFPASLRG